MVVHRRLAPYHHDCIPVGMEPRYLHLQPEQAPPVLTGSPFRAVIVADETVSETWLNKIAEWIVKSGCLYVVAWGVDCEAWHDSVDWAVLEVFNYGDIPDDHFVMTTWHSYEPLSEALWFAEQCAFHPDVELTETVILHIAVEAHAAQLLQTYRDSQVMADKKGS
jgi:acyl carrier protein phosphodiesterase